MKSSIRTGLLLLGCLLVSPIRAFEQGAQQSGPPLNQQFPGPEGLADFRKIVSGEFNGNKSLDAVVMDLDWPMYRSSEEYMDTWISTGNSANDIAVLSGAVPGKDLLVTVEAGGLKLYERVTETSSWNETILFDENSLWANAALVAIGEVNGDGYTDIVGVSANHRDLLFAWGTSDPLDFDLGLTLVNPAQIIHQIVLVNWKETGDDPNTDEIAFYSNLGWAVREYTGAWLKWVNWTSSLVRGVELPGAANEPGRLANIALFAGTDRLTIQSETGNEGPYNLGAIGVVGMAAGDMTTPAPDGDIDLVLTTNTDRDVRIYECQSSVPTFDVASPLKFKFGPANRNTQLQEAGVALGDYDRDGRLDILAPAQGDPNPGQAGAWGCIPLIRTYGGYEMYQFEIDGPAFIPSSNPGVEPDQIRLTFHGASTRLEPGPGQVRTNLVQIFYAPALGTPPDLIPYAVDHLPVPPITGFQYLVFDLPLGYSLETSTGVFSIVAFQAITQDGVIVDRAPATTCMVNPNPNLPITQNTKDTLYSFFVDWGEEIPPAGGVDVGPPVPPFPPEEEPKEANG